MATFAMGKKCLTCETPLDDNCVYAWCVKCDLPNRFMPDPTKRPFPYMMPGDPPPTLVDLENLLADTNSAWAEAMAWSMARQVVRDPKEQARFQRVLADAISGRAPLRTEDLRWRRTVDEPPSWRTRVLVRGQAPWGNAAGWWYDVLEFRRRPYAPFSASWRCEECYCEPHQYSEWRPLP